MVTFHACQQSCPITLSHGWQSSDILAPMESLFLVDCSLNKGQLAKEAVSVCLPEQGKGWHRAAMAGCWVGALINLPSRGQSFVALPLSECFLAFWGQAAGLRLSSRI